MTSDTWRVLSGEIAEASLLESNRRVRIWV